MGGMGQRQPVMMLRAGSLFGGVIFGLYYIGIMENNMGTSMVLWGCIGIMENKMETTMQDLEFGV